jgi:WXG100 family type VII secretion target
MAYSVPPTFEPLASSNPVPANTDAMTTLGQRYTNTAAEIETQANNLKQLTSSTSDQWTGKAATVFASKAGDLSSRILQAQERYSTAGQALTAAAGPMPTRQARRPPPGALH